MKSMTWLSQLMLPYWRRILLALLLSALTVTSHIGLMATSAYLLASAALHPPILDLMVTIVGVRFFGLSRAVLRYVERYVSHDVTFRVLSEIRVKFYQALEPLAPARLLTFRSGDLLSRIVADVEIQQTFFLRIIAPPLVAVMVLFGYGVFLARFDVRFSVILAACFLIAGLMIPWGIKALSQGGGKKIVTLKAQLNNHVADTLMGMTELVSYGQADEYLDKIQRTNSKLMSSQRRIAWLSALATTLVGMMANLGLWLVLVLGIILVEKGKLSGVNLGMLALGTFSSFEVLLPLGLVPHHLEQNRASADRLLELIDTEPAVDDSGILPAKPNELDITFQDVCFRYNQDESLAIDHLSFHIPQHSKVAIVGPSGAGKTSVLNLLLRFWEYDSGLINLGGLSLREYAQEDVRQYIGIVTQKAHLFNATIRENLLLANPVGTNEELVEACQKAKLHDFILSMPQGYDSYIGENGYKLSGGQRQRLAIARVLLKNAPILILDEAMAGLDPLIEREIMDEIYDLMEGRTTLMITHRMIGLEKMDEIFVLNQGQIVEQGKHEELLQGEGIYRRLWEIKEV